MGDRTPEALRQEIERLRERLERRTRDNDMWMRGKDEQQFRAESAEARADRLAEALELAVARYRNGATAAGVAEAASVALREIGAPDAD